MFAKENILSSTLRCVYCDFDVCERCSITDNTKRKRTRQGDRTITVIPFAVNSEDDT